MITFSATYHAFLLLFSFCRHSFIAPTSRPSVNVTYKCSKINPGNRLFWDQKVKGQRHKNIAGVGLCTLVMLASKYSFTAEV